MPKERILGCFKFFGYNSATTTLDCRGRFQYDKIPIGKKGGTRRLDTENKSFGEMIKHLGSIDM